MDLLNKHHTTMSDNKGAAKYTTIYDMSARTWTQMFNKEYMAVTMQVCKKAPCTLNCGDMATE